jgi:hypothetical protein
MPPPVPENSAEAAKLRAAGRYNRDLQQKIGAPAPFDAPEAPGLSVSSSAAAAQSAKNSTGYAAAAAEVYAEAERNKTRMTSGAQNLIAGDYWMGESNAAKAAAARQQGNVPPLMPEAHMKVACAGGSAAALSGAKIEYLNSMVQAQTNRERNEYPRMKNLLG